MSCPCPAIQATENWVIRVRIRLGLPEILDGCLDAFFGQLAAADFVGAADKRGNSV